MSGQHTELPLSAQLSKSSLIDTTHLTPRNVYDIILEFIFTKFKYLFITISTCITCEESQRHQIYSFR